MKTLKRSFILVLSLFIFASCSKKEDTINPDTGAEVAGTYTVTKLRATDGTILTVQAGYTKTFRLIRLSESTVDLSLELGEPGKPSEVLHSAEAVVVKRSGTSITLNAKDGSQIGTYSGGMLEVLVTQAGQSATFIGTKQ